jgi:GntR family transcriptional regulator, transcriptional repressor for pyruvate dehydrogenase complex
MITAGNHWAMLLFRPIRHARTAEEIVHQIEALILDGVLRGRDRLPGERELASATGVSRPIVREAIKMLETAGLLEIRHGEGTFVAEVIAPLFSPQISKLLASHRKATHDYLEYRREIEAIAASYAANRATRADREMLAGVMIAMEAAHEAGDFEREAQVDVEFHSTVGEMTHNLVLLHTLRSCYQLLSEGVFHNRTRLYEMAGSRNALYSQHCAIHRAIADGECDAAARGAREHIDYVIDATRELERREDRERIAGMRLARHDARFAQAARVM